MKRYFLAKTTAIVGLFSSLFLAANGAHAAPVSKDLYVYNWTEYIPTTLLKKFTQQTGIRVHYSTYESNEEMYSKLKLVNGRGYDVIFPSSYYVQLLKNSNLIQPLDKTKLHMNKINPSLLGKPYDPTNTYAVPYVYGITAIGINKDNPKARQVRSWKDLWKPQYTNLMLLNDVLDDFSMALLASGVNPNHATRPQIAAAAKKLMQLSEKAIQFNSDAPEVPYVEGQSDVGMIWTGSAFRAWKEGYTDMDVVYPTEGAILWIDNFAIPKYARNVDAAYKFINFILEPQNSAQIVREMGFQTAGVGYKQLLPKDWQNSKILFPPQYVIQKAIMNQVPTSLLPYYNDLWNKIKVE